MTEPQCKDCKYFLQHYIFSSRGYSSVNCGHCKFPRLKPRKPNTLACVYFVPAGEDDPAPT